MLRWARFLGVVWLVIAAAALTYSSPGQAQTINTISQWDGSSFISFWGAPNTATYGETITATATLQQLQNFTFELNVPAGVNYQAFVYQWNPVSLTITGPALFTSAPAVTPGPGGGVFTPVTVNTGNVPLTPGQQYVLFFTTSTQVNVTKTGAWGAIFSNAYTGGYQVYQNNGTNFSQLSSNAWTASGNVLDLAFSVNVLSSISSIAGQLPAGAPTNAVNVAAVIDAFTNAGRTLPAGFNNLYNLSGGALVNALQQLSGLAGASYAHTGSAANDQFFHSLFGMGLGGGTPGVANGGHAIGYAAEDKRPRSAEEAYAAVTPREAAAIFDRRWNVWATGYGGGTTINGDANAGTNKTTSSVYGAMAGADYGLSPLTRVGFSLGGAGSSFGVANAMGGGKADIFNAAFYGKQLLGQAYVAAAVGYAWQGVTTDRTVTVAGTDQLHAAFDANAFTGRIESGWKIAAPVVDMTPYAALQTTTFWLPSYSETATSGSNQFALSYASQTVTATRGELGLYWEKVLPVTDGEVTLGATTAWAHDWHADSMVTASATFQSLPGSSAFTVNGAVPAHDLALISAGAQMAWANGWAVSGSFDSELANNTHSYGGKGTIRYAFN